MAHWSKNNNNTKVLLGLSSSFPVSHAGYTVRSHAIATQLLQHGVDLSVYTKPGYPWNNIENSNYNSLFDIVDSVTYHRMPFKVPPFINHFEIYRPIAMEQWKQCMKKTGANIVHTASNYENALSAIDAANSLGIKSIYEYRGMWHYTLDSKITWFHALEDFQKYHDYELEAGHKADAVFAISEALKEDLIQEGIAAEKIFILPNAVETKRFTAQAPDMELKKALNLEGKTVVGFIGSLTPYEGLEYLMDAVLELNAKGKDVALVIVGSGAHGYRDMLEAHHKVRGAHPSIIFTGRVPYEEVQRYYSIMDIMPFARIKAKVCQCVPPLKPLEAMAMNKAVIVSDVAALQEMVIPEQTGLVCKASNVASLTKQLDRLVSNPSLVQELTKNAKVWVHEHRDWYNVCKRILKVYEMLLGNKA